MTNPPDKSLLIPETPSFLDLGCLEQLLDWHGKSASRKRMGLRNRHKLRLYIGAVSIFSGDVITLTFRATVGYSPAQCSKGLFGLPRGDCRAFGAESSCATRTHNFPRPYGL